MTAQYRCQRCQYEWLGEPGPTVCQHCQNEYVLWVNFSYHQFIEYLIWNSADTARNVARDLNKKVLAAMLEKAAGVQ